MEKTRSSLSKVLGRTDVLAIGFGTMLGWSWVMLATTWLTQAGFWGAIIAFLTGALIIMSVGAVYGELTAAFPLSGGELVYVYRAMGGKAAWLVGWVMTLAYMGVAAWEGIALATAIDSVLPIDLYGPLWEIAGYTVHLSWAIIGMVGAVVVVLLNLFASRPAVIFQVMATAAVMLVALLLFFGGIAFGSIENIGESFRSLDGFFYVLLMVPAMMLGFDVIPQSAEEMNLLPREMGKMVLVCIVFSMAWYIVIIVGLALAAPVEIRMSGIVPAADVMAYAYQDDTFGTILILGGILGILTSWNGFFMGATRMLFAMGRAKMLPGIFGWVHPKYKTPWAATILVGVVCVAAPLLGQNALIWFVDISSLCSLFGYCCVCMAFVILRKKEPNLNRPFKVRMGIPTGVLVTCMVILYFFIHMRETFMGGNSLEQMAFIGIWLLAGFVLILWARKDFGKPSSQEQEFLIFGEKLARRRSS